MVTKVEKSTLWQTIQRQHPDLAAALKVARSTGSDDVAIDRYPAKTNRWLMDAIRARRPDLAALIVDQILPDREAVKALFGNPELCVAVDDLIGALVEFEEIAAPGAIRKAG